MRGKQQVQDKRTGENTAAVNQIHMVDLGSVYMQNMHSSQLPPSCSLLLPCPHPLHFTYLFFSLSVSHPPECLFWNRHIENWSNRVTLLEKGSPGFLPLPPLEHVNSNWRMRKRKCHIYLMAEAQDRILCVIITFKNPQPFPGVFIKSLALRGPLVPSPTPERELEAQRREAPSPRKQSTCRKTGIGNPGARIFPNYVISTHTVLYHILCLYLHISL